MSFEKIVAGLVVLAFVLFSCAGAAYPQGAQCAPYAVLTRHLADKYAEAMIWQGQSGPAGVVQLWANGDTATWTVVSYQADGAACIVASGTGMEAFTPPPAGTEG